MRLKFNGLYNIWIGAMSILLSFLPLGSVHSITVDTHSDPITEEAEAIAVEAYIYAYPLVTMDLTREVTTNTVRAEGFKAPMGQLMNLRTYPTAEFKDITAPNADTLYSSAFFDVSKEPYILHVPGENDRYYLMPLLSGWTDVFADPGTRTTGEKAQDFAITGPNWRGQLPSGIIEYKSPTNLVWLLGRTYSSGTPEDYAAVHKIQDQYSLKPLSAYGKPYTPPEGKFHPELDIKTPVRDQVNHLDGTKFFTRFAHLLKDNPPQTKDSQIVSKLEKIGIIPGNELNFDKLDSKIKSALSKAPKKALEKIIAHEPKAGKLVNGWSFVRPIGQYGDDYLQRAFVTYFGLGANLAEDAIYPTTNSDDQGTPLSGKNKYVIHFEKDQKPPVKGFWSLTMYNEQYFFVKNPLNRYTLGQRNQFKHNDDGSLDLYIQNQSPRKDKEANWLPAPEGNFSLMFRFYWPEESLIKGEWRPPAVKKVNSVSQ